MSNRDLIEQIEEALSPDTFISYGNAGAFIDDLVKNIHQNILMMN